MAKRIICGLLMVLSSTLSHATMMTYAGSVTEVNNCIPFGCPDSYGPHMGFVYKDIAPFTLLPGDTIAFDTGLPNDYPLSFDLSLAATTTNGGTTATGAGFTLVSSASGFPGDAVIGNYDLAFTVSTAFSFAGGGLIVDFLNTNGVINDTSSEQNLVWSSDNPFTVRRYFSGATAGDMSNAAFGDGTQIVGNMRIISNSVSVPEPASLALLSVGLIGLGFARRRKV